MSEIFTGSTAILATLEACKQQLRLAEDQLGAARAKIERLEDRIRQLEYDLAGAKQQAYDDRQA